MFRVLLKNLYAADAVGLWIFDYNIPNGPHLVAKPVSLEFDKTDEAAFLGKPTLTLPTHRAAELARAIMDGIAESDFMMQKDKGDRELQAVKEHLKSVSEMSSRLLSVIEQKL